jgi:hypothetical protein
MINFSIEKKAYKIESIKLKDLYYIMDQVKYEPKTAGVNIVSHLSGAPVEKIKKLKPFQFAPLYALIDEMIKYKEVPLTRVLNLGGREYGFIPFDELTIGELADLEIIKADTRADFLTHEVLSILYRPITKKKDDEYVVEEYDGAVCKRRSNDFLEADLQVVYGAIFFFITFIQTSTKVMLNHLEQQKEEELMKEKQSLQNKNSFSIGRTFSTLWRRMTHLNSVKPQNVDYTTPSTF